MKKADSIVDEHGKDSIHESAAEGSSILELIPEVWARRKPIGIFVVASTIIAVLIVLLLPPLYTAETSILPELDKGKLLGLGGMADLAAAAGMNVGDAPVSKLYPMIIKSAANSA